MSTRSVAGEAVEQYHQLENQLEEEQEKLEVEGEKTASLLDKLRAVAGRHLSVGGDEEEEAAAAGDDGDDDDVAGPHGECAALARRLDRRLQALAEMTREQGAEVDRLLASEVRLGERLERGRKEEERATRDAGAQTEETEEGLDKILAEASSGRDRYKAEWDRAQLEVQSLRADMAKEIRKQRDLEEKLRQEQLNKKCKRKHLMYKEKWDDAGELFFEELQ